MVVHQFCSGIRTLHLHRLVQIQVEESGLAIAQHIFHQRQRICLQGISLQCAPSYPHLLCLLANHCRILGLREFRQRSELRLTHILAWFPLAKVLIDNLNGLVRIQVATHTDGHIVGYIPFLEIVLDIGDRGVLQVLLRTDGGLCAIGMVGPQQGTDRVVQFSHITGQSDVILLIHSLELGVETTNHHIHKAVALNLSPVLDLVGRDILCITGHIVRCIGVCTLRTDGSHQLIVFIGNVILGSQLTDRVDLMVSLFTGLGIRQLAIGLITFLNLIQQRGLSLRVICTKLFGSLKHQVLQIVRQSCCLRRIVLRTRTHGDVCLDTRLFLVHTQIDFQSIIQGIDPRLCQISLYSLILVLAARAHSEHQQGANSQ